MVRWFGSGCFRVLEHRPDLTDRMPSDAFGCLLLFCFDPKRFPPGKAIRQGSFRLEEGRRAAQATVAFNKAQPFPKLPPLPPRPSPSKSLKPQFSTIESPQGLLKASPPRKPGMRDRVARPTRAAKGPVSRFLSQQRCSPLARFVWGLWGPKVCTGALGGSEGDMVCNGLYKAHGHEGFCWVCRPRFKLSFPPQPSKALQHPPPPKKKKNQRFETLSLLS